MYNYNEHLTTGIATNQIDIAVKTGTKRKRQSHEVEDVAWTASRCNRLLRTINARINLLQRLRLPSGSNRSSKPIVIESQTEDAVPELPKPVPRVLATPTKDPEWLPPAQTRITTKTYAGRLKLRQTAKDRIGRPEARDAIAFPTPFVRRVLQPDLSIQDSESETSVPQIDESVCDKRTKKSRKLPIRPNSSVDEAHRNLVSALDSLLTATKGESCDRKGASSLMNMCLRRVPTYVELEEMEAENLEDDDKFDVTFDLYSELEALGTKEGAGWLGLRGIVRAHGIRKIELGILIGLIPDSVVESLVQTCVSHGAIAESQILMRSILDNGAMIGASTITELSMFCDAQFCDAFLLRMLADLLNSDRLSTHAITEKTTVWRSVLRAITQKESQADACSFLESLTSAYARAEQSPLDSRLVSTFRSVMVLITAMAVTSGENTDDPVLSINTLFSVSTAVHLNLRNKAKDAQRHELTMPLSMAALVLKSMDYQSNTDIQCVDMETLAHALQLVASNPTSARSRNFHQHEADFICDVAKCLHRVDGSIGDETLKAMVQSLVKTSEISPPSISAFLKKLAIDSAMAWADAREDKASLDFAEDVEDLITKGSCGEMTMTPQPKVRLDRYRWEEGLCEWIAMTPMSNAPESAMVGLQPTLTSILSSPIQRRGHSGRKTTLGQSSSPPPTLPTEPPSSPVRTPLAAKTPSALNKVLSTPRPNQSQNEALFVSLTKVSRDIDRDDEGDLDEDELSFNYSAKKPRASIARNNNSIVSTATLANISSLKRPGELRRSLSDSRAFNMDDMSDDELGM